PSAMSSTPRHLRHREDQAAPRLRRPAPRPGHGDHGAGPRPRYLHEAPVRPLGSFPDYCAALLDAVGPPLLRADLRVPGGRRGIPPESPRQEPERPGGLPRHPRPLAGGVGADRRPPGMGSRPELHELALTPDSRPGAVTHG